MLYTEAGIITAPLETVLLFMVSHDSAVAIINLSSLLTLILTAHKYRVMSKY